MMTQEEKQKKWDSVVKEFETQADGLGLGIDKGIFETVVALNCLGFKTTQSCEGHLHHGYAAPWVEFEVPRVEAEYDRFREAMDVADTAYKECGLTDEVKNLFDKAHDIRKQVEEPALTEWKRFLDLLSEFYQEHKASFFVQLILDAGPVRGRMQSQGLLVQEILPEKEKEENLKLYQEEMQAFTEFLKKKFFEV